MIIGAIDVGSNSVKLLVADVKGLTVRPIEHRTKITRLSGGVDRTGRISTGAQDRTIAVLRQFLPLAFKLGASRIVAVGTEALRIARNGRRFAERCRREASVPIRIISAREEARLAFVGATSGRRETRLAAIDIGGGSTEIMLGRPGRLGMAVSLPLGAVRLTETHLETVPPTLGERLALLEEVRGGLERIPARLRRAASSKTILLGIGGTCVNVARMLRPGGLPEGRRVPIEKLEELLDTMAELPIAKRKRLPGIDPDRADIIVAGARILVETMKALGIDSFTATIHGLRRGLLFETAAES